jgi:16S rRNA processing protein RimM
MIVLGRIVAPYGVRGWVRIHPFGDDPASWRRMSEWWLGADAEGDVWQPYKVESLRAHGAGWVAKLGAVDDRNAAESLDGRFIAAPREALPDTHADEYYWADLIGLAVVNEQNDRLGEVTSLFDSSAHSVLVVQDGETERLLPFVETVVKGVDVAGGCIRVAWGKDW